MKRISKKQFYISLIKRMLVPFILCLCLCCTACSRNNEEIKEKEITILCTTFPAYDWTRNIVGDSEHISVELLVDSGVDLHSYQPKAQDIVRISHCDVLVYVGGESDTWVSDAVEQSGNASLARVNMMELVEPYALEEEAVLEAHENDTAEIEYDEHIWLSIFHAKMICQRIADILGAIDSENQELYNRNCELYLKNLDELDTEYREVAEHGKLDTILVGDRFPFLYLVKSYHIRYYAAYSGCSADAEASVHVVTDLADCLNLYDLPVVFTVDNGMEDLAETIIECGKAKQSGLNSKTSPIILNLNSMQSVTRDQINGGDTYISIMKDNLECLKVALIYE